MCCTRLYMLYLKVSLVFYASLSFGPTTWGLFNQDETLWLSPREVLLSHLYHFKAYETLIDWESKSGRHVWLSL